MENELINGNEAFAFLAARLFLGILFLFQGYDALFNIGPKKIKDEIEESYAGKGIPSPMITAGIWFTSLSELAGGLMLVGGIATYPALYLLGINLVMASAAFSLARPMWDTRHVFPRLAVMVFLLLAPPSWNMFSLDFLIKN